MISKTLVEFSKKVGIITAAMLGTATCAAGVGSFVIWLHLKTVVEPAREIAAAQSEKDRLRYEALSLQNQQVIDGIKMVSDIVSDGVYTKKQIDEMRRERDMRYSRIESAVHLLELRMDQADARLSVLLRKR